MRGQAQNVALRIRPLTIPIFGGLRGVEILRPFGKIVAIVGGRDPGAGLGLDPIGGVGGESRGKDGGAVLERNSEDAGLALRGQLEFVAESVGEQVVRRGTRLGCGHANQLGVFVFNRGDHFVLFLVPPFVGNDAVAIAVSTGEKCGVAGSRPSVGVIVIAV